MVQCTVIGARGYLGRETMRLLLQHPDIDTILPVSRSLTGHPFADAVPAFKGRTQIQFVPEEEALEADVLFLATPGGEAKRIAAEASDKTTIIDLSRDHRLAAIGDDPEWHYGLADLEPTPRGHTRIANPGCYPTASLLASAPALQAGLVRSGPVIVDGKSGVSGAGVSPSAALHYPEQNESVRAYKVAGHDHQEEIQAFMGNLATAQRPPVRFTPHLVPQTRGLLATVYLPLTEDATQQAMDEAYAAAYEDSPFVRLVEEPDTAHVRASNHADVAVHVDAHAGLLVARCAIDNLQKGGAGTAIQNMNDALGFPTTAGLDHVGATP